MFGSVDGAKKWADIGYTGLWVRLWEDIQEEPDRDVFPTVTDTARPNHLGVVEFWLFGQFPSPRARRSGGEECAGSDCLLYPSLVPPPQHERPDDDGAGDCEQQEKCCEKSVSKN